MLVNNVKETVDNLKRIADSNEKLLNSQQKKNRIFLILGIAGPTIAAISLIISLLK